MKLWMVLALFGLVALTVGVHAEDEGEAAPESEPEDTPETAATAEESEVTEVKASPASGDDDTAEDPTAEPEAPATEAQDLQGAASHASLYLPALFFSALVALKLAH